MKVDELSGERLAHLVAEKVMGWHLSVSPCGAQTWYDTDERLMAYLEPWITKGFRPGEDIDVAWTVDKPEWFWEFHEFQRSLQVTLYPTWDLCLGRAYDFHLAAPETVFVSVAWADCPTKAAAYALGRCRAALLAVGVTEVPDEEVGE